LKIMDERHSWKALKEETTVAARHHPHIENGKHSPIRTVPDQPPQSLLECNDGSRKLIVHEGIAALAANPVDSRRHQRISRGVEWKLVNDEAAECFAGDIHPVPERTGGKKHRVGVGTELLKQNGLGGISLFEKGVGDPALKEPVNDVEIVMTGEEHQSSAGRDFEDLQDPLGNLGGEKRIRGGR
jgi:hypothetical protein